jgi:hypothetical protein
MVEERNKEIVSLRPGWITAAKKRDPMLLAQEFQEVISFFLIETPWDSLSYKGQPLKEWGWSKKVWQSNHLKNALFEVAKLKRSETFFAAKKLDELKACLHSAELSGRFHQNRTIERIVIYRQSSYGPEVMALFRHIRNSLAHGRFRIYPGEETHVYVMESGIKRQGKVDVRFRAVLKESTLIAWKKLITSGPSNIYNT